MVYRSIEPSQGAKGSNRKVCKSDISGVFICCDRDLDRPSIYMPQAL
jgi:hypothetical protein